MTSAQEYWHDMKFWWPHNETVIATLLAYELTGEDRHARWHTLVHDWSHRHCADPVHGEWYGYLRRDGAVANPTKGNLWKSLFHLPRMQIECWKITAIEKQAAHLAGLGVRSVFICGSTGESHWAPGAPSAPPSASPRASTSGY